MAKSIKDEALFLKQHINMSKWTREDFDDYMEIIGLMPGGIEELQAELGFKKTTSWEKTSKVKKFKMYMRFMHGINLKLQQISENN